MNDPAHGEARPRVRCDRCRYWSFEDQLSQRDGDKRVEASNCLQQRSPHYNRRVTGWDSCVQWERGVAVDKPMEPRGDAQPA